MITQLSIRYIPAWLAGVANYYNSDYSDFEKLISKHDLDLYKLSNHLFATKLNVLGIGKDFTFPDAAVPERYSDDDVIYALFGNNPDRKTVSQFEPNRFKIFSDKNGGIFFIEDQEQEPKCYFEHLLKALAMYAGKDTAYESASFRKFLSMVSIYPERQAAG